MEVGRERPRHGEPGQGSRGDPGEGGVPGGDGGVETGGARGHYGMFGHLEGGHDHSLGAVVSSEC